jgi:hypothetical protein
MEEEELQTLLFQPLQIQEDREEVEEEKLVHHQQVLQLKNQTCQRHYNLLVMVIQEEMEIHNLELEEAEEEPGEQEHHKHQTVLVDKVDQD